MRTKLFGMRNGNGRSPLDITTFRKLSRLYIVALSAIAFSIIFSQFLIQGHLGNQFSDSRVINVAGRQRMLSHHAWPRSMQRLDGIIGRCRQSFAPLIGRFA